MTEKTKTALEILRGAVEAARRLDPENLDPVAWGATLAAGRAADALERALGEADARVAGWKYDWDLTARLLRLEIAVRFWAEVVETGDGPTVQSEALRRAVARRVKRLLHDWNNDRSTSPINRALDALEREFTAGLVDVYGGLVGLSEELL